MTWRAHAIVLLLCLSILTGSSQAAKDDAIVVGKTFMAGSTNATLDSTAWSLVSHGIAEKLFTVDEMGEIVPQVASSVQKVSDQVWDVMLKDGYKFSDGTPVTADLVAKALTEMNTLNPSAQSSLGSDLKAEAIDDLTVRIESTQPTHIMDSVLAEWAFPIYYVDDTGFEPTFVFTGPYAVENFVEDDHIDLVPNVHYPGADERQEITLKKFQDGDALAAALELGQVDVAFHLPVDTLADLRKKDDVGIKSFEVGYHYMVFYNLCKNNMADVRVREAIDKAISRNALSQALQGGKGTRSLFPQGTPYFSESLGLGADEDKTGAEELLDEAGWKVSPSGKRTNAQGEELKVKLVAYPHRPGLVIMQPVIQDTLEGLGITVEKVLTGDDWSETQEIIDEGDFDMLMWAQHTLPAGDPGWFLNAFFRGDGGKNMGCFNSTTVQEILDELSTVEDHGARVNATANAQAAILQEVPVSNLVTPAWHIGLSKRMKDYVPWGSDYYVIRADMPITPNQPESKAEAEEPEGTADEPGSN
ncbi:hypothetical protein A3770_16p78010 [Chloropicon primus]|nr:hypothetical protein A3770_16p78010 [Chloropicon primus]|eukprot:QDZ25283.1 hypothetical protein A3770_16p78010 [Chloropicon primus]